MNLRLFRTWVWLFAVGSAIGLLNFGHFYLDDLARAHYGTGPRRFIEEMTGAYTAMALVPIVVWIAGRFEFTAHGWPRALLANIGGLALYSVLHTTLMAATRAALFPLVGLGSYDYGIMLWRYPMEAANDALFYSLMVAALFFISRIAAARAAQIAAAELQTKLAEAQLENLQLQLHPHFLFNTLNAISAVMYEDVGKADEMLMKLSDFLRNVLALGSVHSVALNEELNVERSYVDIMTTRLERQLAFTIRVEEDAREAQIPFMLLQPLLENSIKHGADGSGHALGIEVAVRREADSTVVEVLDDGVGLPEPFECRGHGLKNVASRLTHMYGEESSFSIASRPGGGTQVTLRFPYSEPPAVTA